MAALVDTVRSAGYDVPAVTATFPVTGMNCAACSGRVEKTVQGLPGVVRAAVNLATERLTVTYLPGIITPAGIARAVEDAGYRMLVARGRRRAGGAGRGGRRGAPPAGARSSA